MASRQHDVATLKEVHQLIGRDAKIGQPRIVVFDEDPFLLNALDLDLGYFWDGEEDVADLVGNVFKLGVAKTLSGQGQEVPKTSPNSSFTKGPMTPLGEIPAGALDLAP